MTASEITEGMSARAGPRCRPVGRARRAEGDADGHDGGGGAGGGVALAEGPDDVQGQQYAGRGVRHAGDHADQQRPPDRPDGEQLPVESEIHGSLVCPAPRDPPR